MRYAAGIDLGGTFVKFALVSEKGDVIFENKLSIGGKISRDDILETIRTSIRMVVHKAKAEDIVLTGIGIGSPGLIYDGIVLGGADNLDRWENIDLRSLFSNEFGLPVFVDNDANVMGLGEVAYGAAKDCTDVIFITVGTGIGGAIVMNNQLYGGYKNRGAELGHIVMEHKGIECNCGGRGCLEAYASTSALIRQYAHVTGLDPETIDGRFIVEKFNSGEEAAIKCMQEHTDYLGHGVAAFINTFAPQKVVIGGGISEAGQFYIDMIKAYAFRYAMRDCAANTEIVAAILGNKAGFLGAATLVFKNCI
jgi:glucokinase